MANTYIDNPPVLSGRPEDQLRVLQSYLYTMSQKLNESLANIGIDQLEKSSQQTIQDLKNRAQQSETGRQGLKELIIKNADISRTEEDEIRAQLERNITTISEAQGTFQQTITANLLATATGIREDLELLESVVGTDGAANAEFRQLMKSYIFIGIIEPNATPPVSGIAIGQDVTNPDGTLNDGNKMITITAKRITFYNNNAVLGYYEGNVYHIAKGEVDDSMKIANFIFKKFADGSMGLMKE